MNVWADASTNHPGLVGASSMYLSHSPSKHANLEGSFLTDDKPTCQRRAFTREDHSGLKTLVVDSSYDVAMKAIKMNERPLREEKSHTEVVQDRIRCVHFNIASICTRYGDCLVEGNALRSLDGNGGMQKRSAYLCMCRIFMVIALAVASMDLKVMFADAAFAPRTRIELQGDGGGTLGVFGCVGSCGRSLSSSDGFTYCGTSGYHWESGSGNPCNNANSAVPSNQGTGTYGTMESWNVSRVDNMAWSKFVRSIYQFVSLYSNILSSVTVFVSHLCI